MTNSPENMPLTLQLILLRSQFGPDNSTLLAGTILLIGIFIVPFAILFGLLQVFVLDRLALVSGAILHAEDAQTDDDLL
jgi:hypothetical protein